VKQAYDYVKDRYSLFQTVVTAAISNRELLDGLAVEVQVPDFSEQELEYLRVRKQAACREREAVRKRTILFDLHHQRVQVEDEVEIVERARLPRADFFAHPIGHRRNQFG